MQMYLCNESRIPKSTWDSLWRSCINYDYKPSAFLAQLLLSRWAHWATGGAVRSGRHLTDLTKERRECDQVFSHSAKFNSSKDQTNVLTRLWKGTNPKLLFTASRPFHSFLSNAGSVVFLDEGVCPAIDHIWQQEIIRILASGCQCLLIARNKQENAIGTSSLCVWCLLPCHWRCLQTLLDSSGFRCHLFNLFHIFFTWVYNSLHMRRSIIPLHMSQPWIAEILEWWVLLSQARPHFCLTTACRNVWPLQPLL